MASFNPVTARIALQIWHLTDATCGECNLADLAEFTGASRETCRSIAAARGWTNRYRRSARGAATSAGSNLIQEADDRLGAPGGMVQW
jgi:hypothetical protein